MAVQVQARRKKSVPIRVFNIIFLILVVVGVVCGILFALPSTRDPITKTFSEIEWFTNLATKITNWVQSHVIDNYNIPATFKEYSTTFTALLYFGIIYCIIVVCCFMLYVPFLKMHFNRVKGKTETWRYVVLWLLFIIFFILFSFFFLSLYRERLSKAFPEGNFLYAVGHLFFEAGRGWKGLFDANGPLHVLVYSNFTSNVVFWAICYGLIALAVFEIIIYIITGLKKKKKTRYAADGSIATNEDKVENKSDVTSPKVAPVFIEKKIVPTIRQIALLNSLNPLYPAPIDNLPAIYEETDEDIEELEPINEPALEEKEEVEEIVEEAQENKVEEKPVDVLPGIDEWNAEPFEKESVKEDVVEETQQEVVEEEKVEEVKEVDDNPFIILALNNIAKEDTRPEEETNEVTYDRNEDRTENKITTVDNSHEEVITEKVEPELNYWNAGEYVEEIHEEQEVVEETKEEPVVEEVKEEKQEVAEEQQEEKQEDVVEEETVEEKSTEEVKEESVAEDKEEEPAKETEEVILKEEPVDVLPGIDEWNADPFAPEKIPEKKEEYEDITESAQEKESDIELEEVKPHEEIIEEEPIVEETQEVADEENNDEPLITLALNDVEKDDGRPEEETNEVISESVEDRTDSKVTTLDNSHEEVSTEKVEPELNYWNAGEYKPENKVVTPRINPIGVKAFDPSTRGNRPTGPINVVQVQPKEEPVVEEAPKEEKVIAPISGPLHSTAKSKHDKIELVEARHVPFALKNYQVRTYAGNLTPEEAFNMGATKVQPVVKPIFANQAKAEPSWKQKKHDEEIRHNGYVNVTTVDDLAANRNTKETSDNKIAKPITPVTFKPVEKEEVKEEVKNDDIGHTQSFYHPIAPIAKKERKRPEIKPIDPLKSKNH